MHCTFVVELAKSIMKVKLNWLQQRCKTGVKQWAKCSTNLLWGWVGIGIDAVAMGWGHSGWGCGGDGDKVVSVQLSSVCVCLCVDYVCQCVTVREK